jgi:hypothetical protein
MCTGVKIITHLKAYSNNDKYIKLVGKKLQNLSKMSIPDEQSDDIYKCLVTLNLLLKINDEMLSKKAIDFQKKQAWFNKIRDLKNGFRTIQNILPIKASALNPLVDEFQKLEYEMVTLFKSKV